MSVRLEPEFAESVTKTDDEYAFRCSGATIGRSHDPTVTESESTRHSSSLSAVLDEPQIYLNV